MAPATSQLRLTLTPQGLRHYGPGGPHPATAGSAGMDLRACMETPAILLPGERRAMPAGMAMELTEPGLAGFVFSRSGLGAKDGLVVAQGVGVIDPDYRGEIVVFLLNTSQEQRTVSPGDRIAQLVVMPVRLPEIVVVDALNETPRGGGGFGHTGTR
ncbi:MAG: dUTP diphosphatase [Desulfovibrio sp.]|nr:dUTP diphosphatase [Desulfovibrio sp.]MCA1985091.1 dUTP diphosphatase [Desulfovibrio sp.]